MRRHILGIAVDKIANEPVAQSASLLPDRGPWFIPELGHDLAILDEYEAKRLSLA